MRASSQRGYYVIVVLLFYMKVMFFKLFVVFFLIGATILVEGSEKTGASMLIGFPDVRTGR